MFDFKGFEAFIPYSLMDHSRLPPAGDNVALDFLIGKTITVKIKEVSWFTDAQFGSALSSQKPGLRCNRAVLTPPICTWGARMELSEPASLGPGRS